MPTVRPALKAAFLLACLAALSGYYFNAFPWPNFLLRFKEILIVAAVVGGAAGWGIRVLALLGIRSTDTRMELFFFSLAAGFGMLGSMMILLGALHAWTAIGGWSLVLAGVGVGGTDLMEAAGLYVLEASTPRKNPIGLAPLLLLATCGSLGFLLALAPTTYYDSLVYHLAMPLQYVQAHHWIPIRELIYSAFPQQIEMLWTLGLLIGDDTFVNLLGACLGFVLLVLIYSFGKRFATPRVGLWAAAMIAVMPSFLLLSSGGYIDVGLTLFAFTSLYAALVGIQTRGTGWFLLAGLLAGWAMGAKYTGAIPWALTGFCILWMKRKQERGGRSPVLLYLGASLLMFLPWLIKNWIFVGNPVFPFFYQWGTSHLNPWLPQAAEGYFRALTEYQPRSLLQSLLIVLEVPLKPLGFGGGADVLGDFGWIPLLWLPPALWIVNRKPRWIYPLLGYAIGFFLTWAMLRPVLRFLLPLAPVLALLAAEGWLQGLDSLGAMIRWTTRGFVGCFILSGLFIFFSLAHIFSPFSVALGLEDRDTFLIRKLNYYGAASFINRQTDPRSSVFVVGDQRGYYYERRHQVTPVFSESPLANWANAAVSPEQLREQLKQAGFTHLVINHPEMKRLAGYHFLDFDPQGQKNWDLLQTRTLGRPLYHDDACDVYLL